MRIFNSVLFLLFLQAAQAESDFTFYTGIGLVDEGVMLTPKGSGINSPLVPELSLGVSWETLSQPDWLIETSLSLSYAQTNNLNINALNDAKLENTGTWIDMAFKYTDLHQDIAPFVSVGAGRVYGRYTDKQTQMSHWQTGYRAFAGIELDVTPKSSISFAVGTADLGHID